MQEFIDLFIGMLVISIPAIITFLTIIVRMKVVVKRVQEALSDGIVTEEELIAIIRELSVFNLFINGFKKNK